MERNSMSNSLKDHTIGSRTSSSNNNIQSNNKLKCSWNYNSQSCGEDYLSGFSWPPRSYTCSFCKREFRSAQALGGHMNVHRRDRARLRQSPPRDGPILNLNVNPNPNPSKSPPFTCTLPSSAAATPPLGLSVLSSPSFASSSETKKWAMDDSLSHDHLSPKSSDLTKPRNAFLSDGFTREDGCKFLKKAEILRLDLEIGLSGSKQDLDLELRLGYS